MQFEIISTDKKSISKELGIKKGDILLSFDGNAVEDMLDIAYYDCEETFKFSIKRGDKVIDFEVEKDAYETMGWNFKDSNYIEPRWCCNKCLFCFVDQLPKCQRSTLYVKDDDWRLSFVSGNFVTLTNLTEHDIERIIEKKFSPLYVSVHATDDDVRKYLLGNSSAKPIIPLMKRFADAGINMFAQIVMCPGINDGEVLKKSLEDLFALYPQVSNVAVVPVGLTKHRCNLKSLTPVDKAIANNTIDLVERFDKRCFDKVGEHFAYCSDEMYIYAERDVLPYEYYGDFEQIENGVGIIADFKYRYTSALEKAVKAKSGSFTLVCGKSATKVIENTLQETLRRFPKLKANVVEVTNNFFGDSVTVSGLLTGGDIVNELSKHDDVGKTILLPRVMLREIENVFLDNMTLKEFCKLTKRKAIITNDGYDLCSHLLELKND